MNLLNKIWLLGAIALVLISCTDNDVINPEIPQGKVPIRLSSSVSLLRSGSQNQQIVSGQELGFHLNITNEAEFNIDNEKLTANGTGGFSHVPMYYPTEGSSFEFTVYHPYTASGNAGGYIDFSIATDQTVKSDYLNSDLLFSKKTGITRTLDAVELSFDHMLSKLSFTIKKGDGADISDLSKIEILDILPSVKMSITDGSLTAASGTKVNVSAYGVTGGAEGVESLTGSAAIIVPQTIESGSKLLYIYIGETKYSYTTTSAIVFEEGMKYDFEIEISATGVTLTSSINNWGDGDSVTGGGVLE
jgi:hypothetical protein